jgi:hypothetical protein
MEEVFDEYQKILNKETFAQVKGEFLQEISDTLRKYSKYLRSPTSNKFTGSFWREDNASVPKASELPAQPITSDSLPEPPEPLLSQEQQQEINNLYQKYEEYTLNKFKTLSPEIANNYTEGKDYYDRDEAWIQTFSGYRFNPTNPNVNAIVIQDIAHALSMQCRFSGHIKKFYSVAQHSVLVSYLCDRSDALWGLLHDGSEAYLVDVPRPLKRSGKFEGYLSFEKKVQAAICQRFGLEGEEPESVKLADKLLLVTEARDLMPSLRPDWIQEMEPLPVQIIALSPEESKQLFLKRFFELTSGIEAYDQYLDTVKG